MTHISTGMKNHTTAVSPLQQSNQFHTQNIAQAVMTDGHHHQVL